MKKKILTILGVLVLFTLAYFLYQNFHKEKEVVNPYINSSTTSEIFETENGFGYKIFIDGNLYVEQPTIPAVSGNKSFDTEIKAQKTADFAIGKIRSGIIPPTISVDELKSLGIVE
jgi:hypothetical protein